MTFANLAWIAFVALLVIVIAKCFDHLGRRRLENHDRDRREMQRAAETELRRNQ